MIDHKKAIVGGGHFFHLGFFGKGAAGENGRRNTMNVPLNGVYGRFGTDLWPTLGEGQDISVRRWRFWVHT
jgi:hypothetical protein